MKKNLVLIVLAIFIVEISFVAAQNNDSGFQYHRTAILNGNQVKTVFGNWGVIGQPATSGSRGAWIYPKNGYIGDVSPLVGAEVNGKYLYNGMTRDTTFRWVIDTPVERPSGQKDFDDNRMRRAFEPVSGYFNPNQGKPAMSNDENSWPEIWPDKANDAEDPGWPGVWNGLFGKFASADLETFFVMDDDADNEFSSPDQNPDNIFFHPIPSDETRQGLGLEMRVRGLQWQQILAQDNIFWVYEITNNGTATYNRTVFGMLVGTYVGTSGATGSDQEYDDDWSFFDVNEDLTYTGDYGNDMSRNPFWVGPVGIVGYAFLESPGNGFDGIDNDRDSDSNVPEFVPSDFEAETITNNTVPGQQQRNKVVVIDQETFERTVLTFPSDQDTFVVVSQGETITLISNETVLAEGKDILFNGVVTVNPNATDGIDNDLDGLIDENYLLHYRQYKLSTTGVALFDEINPVGYIDYLSGNGLGSAMIDERRDDGIDNDNDWSRNPVSGALLYDDSGILLDDVGEDGVPGTNDMGENDGQPTAGEPNFDQLDKDESDQIGLTSFNYFTPANEIELGDEDVMWNQLAPGYFSVPETFQNGRPTSGEDGDFTYGSGFFPLRAGQKERMSLALIYGKNLEEMVKKLQTVRDIYNANYRFPVAPDKPKVTAVAGSDSVVLYWDRSAEFSFDPVLRTFDFEGYKIYRSTDPDFNDARDITNSVGSLVAYTAIAQFDKINRKTGFFYPPNDIFQILQGWSFYLGKDTGLKHSFVDYDVQNGRRYFYAVVSYDHGADSSGIIPSECTKTIVEVTPGNYEFDVNTVSVIPGEAVAGYKAPKQSEEIEHVFGNGFGAINYKILDPTKLTGHDYEIYFWDTSNDGIDNNKNWTMANDIGADGIANTADEGEGNGQPTPGEPNFDFRDPVELASITTHYAVKDLYEFQEEFYFDDTNFVAISRKNLVEGSISIQDGAGNVINSNLYKIDHQNGWIRALSQGTFDNGMYLVNYQYHPVYFSEYIQNTPYVPNTKESDIFDGITLAFNNTWITQTDTAESGWNNTDIKYSYDINFEITTLPDGTKLNPVFFPSNYQIEFSDDIIDTTGNPFNIVGLEPSPRKFKITNLTGDYKIKYYHVDINGDSTFSKNERIIFLEKDPDGEFLIYTWTLLLKTDITGYSYVFTDGDDLVLSAQFPFNKFDTFRFATGMPEIDKAKAQDDLEKINVYPNPYIVSHKFEPNLASNITSGRGERQIFFTNIPADAKIHIFTVRGEKVITLKNDDTIFNGTVIWNLKTRENLEIAYGVYFYVVESSLGNRKGKIAVIK